MIDPINVVPVISNKRTKHGESFDSMRYFAWQEDRKAKKKHQPLWCRDYKKIPPRTPKSLAKSNGLMAKIKRFIGGD